MSNSHENYLRDVVNQIVERAKEAKVERDNSGGDYEMGQLMAYHDVVSLIQQQAEAFGLTSDEIGMPSIDPDLELL